jgi:hemolysin activation/secretion protein
VPRDTQERLKALKGIVFLSGPKELKRDGLENVSGLDVSRFPDLQNDAFRARMDKYLGKPVSFASVEDLVQEVFAYFSEIDRPFVVVTSPEQDITNGVLQLVVIEGRVGELQVTGAKHFDESIYRNALGLKPGDRISKRKLDADIDWLNRNPFRDTSVGLAPGKDLGTTDVRLRTQERKPLRFYAGFDDSGTDVTDNHRVQLGVNWGNVLGLDHQLSYQFSASPNIDTYRAHSATYVAPLPWKHLLTVFGAHADIQGKVPAPFTLHGRSSQLGLRYEIPLQRHGSYTHAIVGGLDYKRTNSNLEFGGAGVSANSAEIMQGVLSYQGASSTASRSTNFSATVFYSPGDWTSGNKDVNFSRLRALAESRYAYANFKLQNTLRLSRNFSWYLAVEAQAADGNLLGSEQLGAGGYATVRGYDERQANGDQGFLVRNELRTRFFNLGVALPGKPAQLQFLTFVDYGNVGNKRLLVGENKRAELASAGLGVRFGIDTNVSVRFDHGWQLRDIGGNTGPKNSRAHFSLLVSY